MRNKPKIIIVVGPTASGKSDFAIKLAKKINPPDGGEIISADSRQVYKGLDIGTAKVKGQHCTDISSPKKRIGVIEWRNCAEKAIAEIENKNKTPIIVGGTGFYIKALVDGIIIPKVPPKVELRKKLEKKTLTSLLKILDRKDPRRGKTIDRKNKRRVIRALEIIDALGKVPKLKAIKKYEAEFIGIKRSDKDLKLRIEDRTKKMIDPPAGGGLIQEVKKLKLSQKRLGELGFEYKYPGLYLQKKISKQEMVDRINKETIDYARRQMLWWKKDKRIKWISPISRASRRSP